MSEADQLPDGLRSIHWQEQNSDVH